MLITDFKFPNNNNSSNANDHTGCFFLGVFNRFRRRWRNHVSIWGKINISAVSPLLVNHVLWITIGNPLLVHRMAWTRMEVMITKNALAWKWSPAKGMDFYSTRCYRMVPLIQYVFLYLSSYQNLLNRKHKGCSLMWTKLTSSNNSKTCYFLFWLVLMSDANSK